MAKVHLLKLLRKVILMYNCKIKISNLGPISSGTITLKNITVFIGQNNTGKTYLLNSLYYFQSLYFKELLFEIIRKVVAEENLLKHGDMKNINYLLDVIFKRLAEIDILKQIFKDDDVNEVTASFKIDPPTITFSIIVPLIKMFISKSSLEAILNTFPKNKDIQNILNILNVNSVLTLKENEEFEVVLDFLFKVFGKKATFEIILKSFLCNFFNLDISDKDLEPKSYLFPVERAGINKFFFESISRLNHVNLALKSLIEFKIRLHHDTLKNNLKESAYFSIARELELKIFNGGEIITEKSFEKDTQIIFCNNLSQKFNIEHFSSSINELSVILLYLKYYAKKGDIILIDEPELSLHPDSQRIFIKYVAILSKMGLKFIMITHSDYIAKEFNNLICLSDIDDDSILSINKENSYTKEMSLTYNEINMYSIFNKDNSSVSIEAAEQTKFGFDEKLFTNAINCMDRDSYNIFNLINEKDINNARFDDSLLKEFK